MKRFLSCFFSVALLFSVSWFNSSAEASWTVMCYFVSESKIESGLISNLNQMAQVSSTNNLKIVVQFDYASKGAIRYFMSNGKANPVQELGEVNMGSPQTLYDFIKWSMKNYPSDNYFLIINSHGSGWESYYGPGSTETGPDVPPVPIQRSRFSSPDFPAYPALQYSNNRSLAYDDNPEDCLTVAEIRQVLLEAKNLNQGKNINILSADACLFSMLEVCYELRDCVNIVEASASTMPSSGLSYNRFLSILAKNPAMNERELAGVVAETFVRSALGDNVLTAVDVKATENIARNLDSLVKKIVATGIKPKFSTLTPYGESKKYWDIGTLARAIENENTSLSKTPVFSEIKALATSLRESISRAIVSEWYSGRFATNKVAGISIYWPDSTRYQKYRPYYKTLSFAKNHLWDNFLDWYFLNTPFENPEGQLVRQLERLYENPPVSRNAALITLKADRKAELENSIISNAIEAHKNNDHETVRKTLEQVKNSRLIPEETKKRLLTGIIRNIKVNEQ